MKTLITIVIVVVLAGLAYRIVAHPGATPTTSPVITTTTATSTDETPVNTAFTLSSAAFNNGDSIPSQYTCDGAGTQIPVSWQNAPDGTVDFALTMFDPDVPKQVKKEGFFDHMTVFNIPATSTNYIASSTAGVQGNNGSGKVGYVPPCPPSNYKPTEHRYIFTLYALDSLLNLKKGATRADVEKAAATHTLATTTLLGRYQKIATTTAQ